MTTPLLVGGILAVLAVLVIIWLLRNQIRFWFGFLSVIGFYFRIWAFRIKMWFLNHLPRKIRYALAIAMIQKGIRENQKKG